MTGTSSDQLGSRTSWVVIGFGVGGSHRSMGRGLIPSPGTRARPPTLRLHPLFHLRNLQDGETANFRAKGVTGSRDYRVRGVTPVRHGGGDPPCELSGLLGNPTSSTTEKPPQVYGSPAGGSRCRPARPPCPARFAMTPTARLFKGVCDPPIIFAHHIVILR